jgi:hypothetical protein
MFKRTENWFASDRVGAYVDAVNKSRENRRLWPDSYIKGGEHFAERVREVYPGRRVFFNIRKKWLAVKVEGPTDWERDSTKVRNFDWYAANSDVDIVETATGVIYRLRDAA